MDQRVERSAGEGRSAAHASSRSSLATSAITAEAQRKVYGLDPTIRGAQRRYSPPMVTSTQVTVVSGDPDPGEISTSYVERQNLTMRMGMAALHPAHERFSKKVENLAHAVSLHYMHYNSAASTRRSDAPRRKRLA